MAGTGVIRSSPKNELKPFTSKQRAASAALCVCSGQSVCTIRLVDVDRCSHAVVERLLITAVARIDAGLALALKVFAVVRDVGM